MKYDPEAVAAHSYSNFHAKGLDYLCLERSDGLTRKVYFFDGDLDKLPEIVMPHDHRYDFATTVLSGLVVNRLYHATKSPLRGTEPWERFAYHTPLNGGNGFTWVETVNMARAGERTYRRGQSYWSQHSDIHTLQIMSDRSVIVLDQYEDVLPLSASTSAYRKDGRDPPSLSGLYDRMTPETARKRLAETSQLMALINKVKP